MAHTVKIYDTCIGCTQCVRACPTDVLEMVPWDGCRANQVASALLVLKIALVVNVVKLLVQRIF